MNVVAVLLGVIGAVLFFIEAARTHSFIAGGLGLLTAAWLAAGIIEMDSVVTLSL